MPLIAFLVSRLQNSPEKKYLPPPFPWLFFFWATLYILAWMIHKTSKQKTTPMKSFDPIYRHQKGAYYTREKKEITQWINAKKHSVVFSDLNLLALPI